MVAGLVVVRHVAEAALERREDVGEVIYRTVAVEVGLVLFLSGAEGVVGFGDAVTYALNGVGKGIAVALFLRFAGELVEDCVAFPVVAGLVGQKIFRADAAVLTYPAVGDGSILEEAGEVGAGHVEQVGGLLRRELLGMLTAVRVSV